MKVDNAADDLLRELFADPPRFVEQGRDYQLLQLFFRGLPVEILRPLLQNPDPWVHRTAAFVASELGRGAATLVDDVVSLVASPDIHAQNYAMEVLTVCSLGEKAGLFAHVVRKLESDHRGLRLMAMNLVAGASAEQLDAAARFFEQPDSEERTHSSGLRALLAEREVPSEAVAAMLQDEHPLVRRYGAMLARKQGQFRAGISHEIGLADSELQEFFAQPVA